MSFFSSIPIWGWFDIFFNFAVLVALCGEADWALKRLIPKKPNVVPSAEWRRKKLKKKFEWLLIFGIAGEVACLPFSLIESADANKAAGVAMQYAANSSSNSVQVLAQVAGLNKEAADARVIAGNAEIEAGQANERAANTESNNLVLQKELQPRIITQQNIIDFIFLTEKIGKKIPIKIHVTSYGDDTLSFSIQLRTMLDDAKFLRDSSENGIEMDAKGNGTPIHYITRKIGATEEWPSVFFVIYSTNDIYLLDNYIPTEITNGFVRPIVSDQNPKEIYEAIQMCMDQIKIKTAWVPATWIATNEYEIFVPAKNN
jgi:hypothetical protein